MGCSNSAVNMGKILTNGLVIIRTFRSILNFQIGDDAELMPKEIISAMVTIKKAAATVNTQLNGLPIEISEAIQQAADEVSRIKHYSLY